MAKKPNTGGEKYSKAAEAAGYGGNVDAENARTKKAKRRAKGKGGSRN